MILIVRDDGVIRVDNAVPVDHALVETVRELLDTAAPIDDTRTPVRYSNPTPDEEDPRT